MNRLSDKEINLQYEILMNYDCITVTRESALMMLDEIICSRMKEKESIQIKDGENEKS